MAVRLSGGNFGESDAVGARLIRSPNAGVGKRDQAVGRGDSPTISPSVRHRTSPKFVIGPLRERAEVGPEPVSGSCCSNWSVLKYVLIAADRNALLPPLCVSFESVLSGSAF
jgi:hypothetical protein